MTDKLVTEKFAGSQQAVKVPATALGLQMLLQQDHGLGIECFCQQPPTAFQRGGQACGTGRVSVIDSGATRMTSSRVVSPLATFSAPASAGVPSPP